MFVKTHSPNTVLAGLLAGAALALSGTGVMAQAADQGPQTSSSASSGAEASGGGEFITAQESSQVLANSIIGTSVKNGPGDDAEEIGKVTDLILDEDHKLVGVVVGVGGFLGIGQKDVGIAWDDVKQVSPESKVVEVQMSKKDLQDAPEFVSTEAQKKKEEQAQPAGGGMGQQPAAPMGGTGQPAGTPQ